MCFVGVYNHIVQCDMAFVWYFYWANNRKYTAGGSGHAADMRGASRQRPPRLPIKVLIPGSRLAAVAGHLYTSNPVVSDGDNVYEVNLSGNGHTADQQVRRNGNGFAVKMEAWMLLDTERAFLRYIAGEWVPCTRIVLRYHQPNRKNAVFFSPHNELYLRT